MKSNKKFFNYLFSITIFLSSFLLFFIQPLMGKFLLPYFGGGSFVWLITLCFFIVMLFFGYLYVFFITKLDFRKQIGIHIFISIFLICLHLVAVFIDQERINFIFTRSSNFDFSFLSIIFVLFKGIGFLFLILASTNSLLQKWYGNFFKNQSPYFLYSISNLGSVLGLLSFPLFFELFLKVQFKV